MRALVCTLPWLLCCARGAPSVEPSRAPSEATVPDQPTVGARSEPEPVRSEPAVTDVRTALSLTPEQDIQTQGTFAGYRGTCSALPPTRSAWQLEQAASDGTSACMYIAGPAPAGTHAGRNVGIGKAVIVKGRLRSYEGVNYIEAKEVTP